MKFWKFETLKFSYFYNGHVLEEFLLICDFRIILILKKEKNKNGNN